MSVLRYDDVRFAYPGGEPALTGVDLEVAPGAVLLLVGSSGSGKSTLLRCGNGLVPHVSGGRFGGDVVVAGRSTRTHPPRALADVVGFVHQDPEAQLVVDEVERDVAFVLENLGMATGAMRRRVEEVLDALGIAHLRRRSPATLSGGERQRCAIAGALAAGPSVLLLDEPTSQLDPQGADDVLAAVGRLNDDLGTTVVLAEHRLERAAPLATAAAMVEGGRIAAAGTPQQVLAEYPGAPTVTRLGRALGWDPLPLTVRQARALAGGAAAALGPGGPGPIPSSAAAAAVAGGAPLVTATGVRVDLGGRTVLSGVELDVVEGEVVAVLGRNGAGKSTLLRALAGLVGVRAGRVARSGAVAYVPQDPGALLFRPTVRREVEETLRLLGGRGRGGAAEVDRWLAVLGLSHLEDRHPRSLSGGERQRLAVAAVAVGGAPVLALDEPTRGMDAAVPHRPPGRGACACRGRRGGGAGHARRRARSPLRDPRRRARRRRGGGAGGRPDGAGRVAVRPADAAGAAPVPHRRRGRGGPGGGGVVRVEPRREPASRRDVAGRTRPLLVYLLVAVVGAGAFLFPFWVPVEAAIGSAHAGDAPIVTGAVAALVVAAVTLEVRRGTMNGAAIALLGVLSASAALGRLLDLPGGGSGIFFLVVLAGAAFGPRFGLLLGLCSMATSALLTGGVGPWLPFQMLALGWMGAGAGAIGRLTARLPRRVEVAALAATAGLGVPLRGDHEPVVLALRHRVGPAVVAARALLAETLRHYWRFYVLTSFPWDAAGALANAVAHRRHRRRPAGFDAPLRRPPRSRRRARAAAREVRGGRRSARFVIAEGGVDDGLVASSSVTSSTAKPSGGAPSAGSKPRGGPAPGPPPGSAAVVRAPRGAARVVRSHLSGDAGEEPVHELPRVVGRVALGELDGLRDDRTRRHVCAVGELVGGDPQERPVDGRHPFDRPALGEPADQAVHLLLGWRRRPRRGRRRRARAPGAASRGPRRACRPWPRPRRAGTAPARAPRGGCRPRRGCSSGAGRHTRVM
jgi:energy-coupling factor transport system ATP-binding protein